MCIRDRDITTELGVPVYRCFVMSRRGEVAQATGANLCGSRAALAALTEVPWPYPYGEPTGPAPVSYTHLDVYKRQEQASLPLAQPARSGRATSQMSLLDAMPQESAPALDDVSALPDCGDARVALIWAHGDREAPYLAVEGADGGSLGEWQWTGPVAELARWLAPARTLVTADLKGLLTSASCWQFLAGRAADCIDLGVAAYLLNPEENDYGWPRLSARWGAVLRHELESRGETASGPARLGLAMAQLFEQRMEKDGLLELFRRLEMPLLPVLAGMEQSGVAIDAAAFRAFLDDGQGQLDQLTAHVYELEMCIRDRPGPVLAFRPRQ